MIESNICFDPIIDKDSRILILGSFPGVKSLEEQQYYAHPRNQFWKILFTLLNEDFSENYQDRIHLVQKHKIALWDVINTCDRKGSLDSAIENEERNDLLKLLEQNPQIKSIYCNGKKAYESLLKLVGFNFNIPINALPSTSPAHAALSFQGKLEQWSSIKKYL